MASPELSTRLLFILVPVLFAAARNVEGTPRSAPHLALERSDPANASRLATSPERITLWFTARPQLAFSRIRLSGAGGDIVLDTIVADTGNALHARIPRPLGAGAYRVIWQTASGDGHPIRGEFAFTVVADMVRASSSAVDAPSADRIAAPDTAVITADHVPTAAQSEYRSARWIEFVALLTVLGALGFRHAVLPPLASRGVPTADAADRARRLGQSALALYVIAAGVRLYTVSAALNGPQGALGGDALIRLVTTTAWGMGWTTGITGALLVVAGWSTRRVSIGTPLALTGALGLVASPALTGHAAASEAFITAVTLDMLHVLAAAVWLGGLLMVLLAGIPAMRRLPDGNRDAAVSALVNSFHPVALFCAPVVVAAGLATSWLRLGSVGALTTTRYGAVLLIKLALFILLTALAFYNSTHARRALGTGEGTARVRRSAALELVFAALVLVATAVLVTTPTPAPEVQQ